jgi:hypothetical protein
MSKVMNNEEIRDALWRKYVSALKRQDTIRINVHNLQSQTRAAEKQARKHNEYVKNLENLMRGFACGFSVDEMIANMDLTREFLPKDYKDE